MTFTDEQVMLTLAGLTYRGFASALSSEPNAAVVCREVLEGLRTLSPVRDVWELVWGPATHRGPRAVFDSSAMYVVRDRVDRHRYVVAIRGTNPIALEDWLIGDFWVRSTVPWPYAAPADGAAISASTAVGLSTIQQMRSPGVPSPAAPSTSPANSAAALVARIQEIDSQWGRLFRQTSHIVEHIGAGNVTLPVPPVMLRPTLPAHIDRAGSLDLLSFLGAEAADAPRSLDVAVTGHSKGGALAPAVALWLKEALTSGDPRECWDTSRSARVSCHAFAGPTPGNAGFARRLEAVLGADHHHLRNMNDVVTHAWQDDELRQVPGLYGLRSEPFRVLFALIAAVVQPLAYRQAQAGVRKFSGGLDTDRPFGAEFIHQHMEAYLEELELVREGIRAITFFI
jgi:lipase (class 3)